MTVQKLSASEEILSKIRDSLAGVCYEESAEELLFSFGTECILSFSAQTGEFLREITAETEEVSRVICDGGKRYVLSPYGVLSEVDPEDFTVRRSLKLSGSEFMNIGTSAVLSLRIDGKTGLSVLTLSDDSETAPVFVSSLLDDETFTEKAAFQGTAFLSGEGIGIARYGTLYQSPVYTEEEIVSKAEALSGLAKRQKNLEGINIY